MEHEKLLCNYLISIQTWNTNSDYKKHEDGSIYVNC